MDSHLCPGLFTDCWSPPSSFCSHDLTVVRQWLCPWCWSHRFPQTSPLMWNCLNQISSTHRLCLGMCCRTTVACSHRCLTSLDLVRSLSCPSCISFIQNFMQRRWMFMTINNEQYDNSWMENYIFWLKLLIWSVWSVFVAEQWLHIIFYCVNFIFDKTEQV